jgi:hypothetical protein
MTTTPPTTAVDRPTSGSVDPFSRSPIRTVGRWMITFLGFPLGGWLAVTVAGPVDSVAAALIGGAITGLVLGAVQAWALKDLLPRSVAWTAVTGIGLAVGLALGSLLVDYATDRPALLIQGAVTGGSVGLLQAVVLRPRLRTVSLLWPLTLAVSWALGWLISGVVIADSVDEQFVVFGSSGALAVTALTSFLPLRLARRGPQHLTETSSS